LNLPTRQKKEKKKKKKKRTIRCLLVAELKDKMCGLLSRTFISLKKVFTFVVFCKGCVDLFGGGRAVTRVLMLMLS
jgi:hypothetical protein